MILLRCLFVLALMGLTACSTKPPKDAATLRMYLPASPALPDNRRMPVVVRTPALSLQIDRIPVLTENDLDHVDLTGEGDNFAMRLYFNTHGTIMLDSVSLSNRGQLIIVLINGVAVAAPMLKERIVDGIFEFTPDLSREDAEKVVKGLNDSIAWLAKHPQM